MGLLEANAMLDVAKRTSKAGGKKSKRSYVGKGVHRVLKEGQKYAQDWEDEMAESVAARHGRQAGKGKVSLKGRVAMAKGASKRMYGERDEPAKKKKKSRKKRSTKKKSIKSKK